MLATTPVRLFPVVARPPPAVARRPKSDSPREFAEYYNRVRSRTERDHLPPIHSLPDEVPMLESEQIVVKSYVGGLVKSFERKAA